jgi:hypothetical protein
MRETSTKNRCEKQVRKASAKSRCEGQVRFNIFLIFTTTLGIPRQIPLNSGEVTAKTTGD